MSELGDFYHIDGQPHVEFEYDDDIYDLNWGNTTVYLHYPPHGEVDHLFVTEYDEATTALTGIFMFRQTIPNFTQVGKRLIEYNYRFSKSPLPADVDLDALVRLNTRDLLDE